MRVIGPATPKPQSSAEQSSKIYGSTLPDLERAPEPSNPAVSTASKGSKQERFEREIRERDETIEYLRKKLNKTEAEISELQRKITKFDGLVAKFDAEKDSTYSKGKKDGNAAGRTEQVRIDEIKFKELASEIERLRTENDSLNRRLLTYKEDFMTEVREKEKELSQFKADLDRRDSVGYEKVEKKQAEVDEVYAKANQWYDEVRAKAKIIDQELKERNTDLNVREQKLRTRKNQRLDYNAYRYHYRFVHDERKTFDDKIKIIQKQLARERAELDIYVRAKSKEPNAATSDQAQIESASDRSKTLAALDLQLEGLRKTMSDADSELKDDAHTSRLNTKVTRYGDVSLAADVATAALYAASINPLRSVKTRTQKEIREIEAKMEAASNATLREELGHEKDARVAELHILNCAIDLAYIDLSIQTWETLKLEPYPHKAAHVKTADNRADVDSVSKDVYEGKVPKVGVASLRLDRENLDRQAVFEKQRAQVLEVMGNHTKDERDLDRQIDVKIAHSIEQLQSKREKVFGYYKELRTANKHIPIRARPTTSPSADAREASSIPNEPELRIVYSTKCREKAGLLKVLSESEALLDPVTRAEKVHRVDTLTVELADSEIALTKAKIIAMPRKQSEIAMNKRRMKAIQVLKRRRARAMERLERGSVPILDRQKKSFANGIVASDRSLQEVEESTAAEPRSPQGTEGGMGPEQHLDEPKSSEPAARQRYMQLELRKLKDELNATKEAKKPTATLELQLKVATKQLADLYLQIVRQKIRELGPVTSDNEERHKQLEFQIKIREKYPSLTGTGLTRRQRVSKEQNRKWPSRTTFKRVLLSNDNTELDESATQNDEMKSPDADLSEPETADTPQGEHSKSSALDPPGLQPPEKSESQASSSNRSGPAYRRLDLSPSSPKKAAHVFHARRELHDSLLWPSSERKQLPLHETVLPKGAIPGASSELLSEHGATLTDGQQDGLHGFSSGFSDKGADRDNIAEMGTEAARDDSNATSHVQAAPASLSSETSTCSTSNNNNIDRSPEHSITMAETEGEAILKYEIPLADKRNALIASRNSTASFWKYSLYKNAAGESPTRHYCTTFEQTEAKIANFLGEKVVGFDLEWEKFKSKPGEDSTKRAVSLMQVASEGRVALFHLALFRGGDSVEDLLPPSLRTFLENPEIIKVGVNIGGDATRLRNCFGVQMQGNIELSHLYKVVTYGESQPEKVNRGLYSLANQVKEVLHLPLAKDGVRTSSWSKRLNVQQIEYAASDAYAGLRLYYDLERRRKAMESKPPRPAFHELALPIMLGGGQVAPSALRKSKQAAEAVEEPTEEPNEEAAALQEPNDGEDAAEESSDDFFDTAEDLEALDAYVESQDAAAGASASASLPEITYPTLPPLEPISNATFSSTQSSIDLPSDPLAPPPNTTFHSPQAATADAWATTWQSQLPQAYNLRVSQPHLRAYHLWHHQGYSLQETAELLRKQPLALSTVVSYVAEVLQKEELEFDEERVKEVRARLPASVRSRYGRLYAKGGG